MGLVKKYEAWQVKRDARARRKEIAEEKRLSSTASKARKDTARLKSIERHRTDIATARGARFKSSWVGKAATTAQKVGKAVQKYDTYTRPKKKKGKKKRSSSRRDDSLFGDIRF